MKKTYFYIFCVLYALKLISCGVQERSNEETTIQVAEKEWRELRCGLYINTKGDLAFFSNQKGDKGESVICEDVYITSFGYDDSTQLKDIIDTATFEYIGAIMFKDKNRIYRFSPKCDGGYFYIFSDDTSGFTLLNDYYYKYKSNIYHYSYGEIDADAETFTVFEDFDNIVKDKDGFFEFNERVTDSELKERLGEELFQKLK